jgi:hypothetical protein
MQRQYAAFLTAASDQMAKVGAVVTADLASTPGYGGNGMYTNLSTFAAVPLQVSSRFCGASFLLLEAGRRRMGGYGVLLSGGCKQSAGDILLLTPPIYCYGTRCCSLPLQCLPTNCSRTFLTISRKSHPRLVTTAPGSGCVKGATTGTSRSVACGCFNLGGIPSPLL